MNNMPPQFDKKKKNVQSIVTILISALLSIVLGFASSMVAMKLNTTSSNGNGVTIVQQNGDNQTATYVHDVSDIASKCGPSVVEIQIVGEEQNTFFGSYTPTGAGSGVIISEDGYIVTNNHVVEGAKAISVRTTDGNEYEATLIGTDPQTDIGVIKIEAQNLVAAVFGDSDVLEVGDGVVAIGNPLGQLGGTVTTGIISALERQITIGNEIMTLLQTDAAINPGNSGGGLFDTNGNLIGIVNAKQSASGIEGLGFAIPINSVIEIINELIENGTVTSRPALNVSLYDYNESSSYYYNQSKYESGCYIVQILPGGAADQADLKINDRIIQFDGTDITSSAEVKSILRKHSIGDSVEMKVNRDGEEITVNITLQPSRTE